MKLTEAMTAAISEVLETMFFMPPVFDPNATPENSQILEIQDNLACRIEFKGPASGILLMIVPEALAGQLSSNFMGLDQDEVTHTHRSGTVKELTNMVIGNTCSLMDPSVESQLTLPEIINPADAVRDLRDESRRQSYLQPTTTAGAFAVAVVRHQV